MQLNVHVDFDHLLSKLGTAVDHYIRLVSIGYKTSQQPIDEQLRMPGSGWVVSLGGRPAWSSAEASSHYQNWILATGLRDVLEAFASFLDVSYEIACVIRLIQKEQTRGGLIGEDVLDCQADVLKYKRLGVEKKVSRLKSVFLVMSADLEDSVLSINRARNILAHHDGIVPTSYLDANGVFRITWTRLTLKAVGAEDREVQLGETLREGEGLGLKGISEHRDFAKEERVTLAPIEFSGISWTIFTAGVAIKEALLNEWGRLRPAN